MTAGLNSKKVVDTRKRLLVEWAKKDFKKYEYRKWQKGQAKKDG